MKKRKAKYKKSPVSQRYRYAWAVFSKGRIPHYLTVCRRREKAIEAWGGDGGEAGIKLSGGRVARIDLRAGLEAAANEKQRKETSNGKQ